MDSSKCRASYYILFIKAEHIKKHEVQGHLAGTERVKNV
jgi:hypothetical protein